jgi:hypothetical protein
MIFLAALLALPLIGQWYRLPGKTVSPSKLASFVSGFALLSSPFTLWSLYSLHAFGHLLPNTNAAKRAGPTDSVAHRLLTIYTFGFPLILFGLLACIVYLLLRPTAVRRSLQSAIASIFRPHSEAATEGSASLPLGGWIFLLWPSIATLFYIANHTYVQTRYILVTAPGLTLVILLLALAAAPHTARFLYCVALVAALAVSLVTTRPFICNKGIDDDVTRNLALYIHNCLPPDAPVAVYSIGEIAFVSQHPIIDTGGITRPGAIPYLNSPPKAMLRWAQSEGAQYFIGDRPSADAILIYSADQRFIGWSLRPALYATTSTVQLWKLAPAPVSKH